MINKENILKTAQSLVQQYNLPLKIRGVEELPEAVAVYFTSEKKVKLRELAQELEIQLNLPIKLERIKKEETGKIGGVDILGNYTCCAPFLRKCPFGEKFGCGYRFTRTREPRSTPMERRGLRGKQENKKTQEHKNTKTLKHKDKEAKKTKKKVVRRLVLKG